MEFLYFLLQELFHQLELQCLLYVFVNLSGNLWNSWFFPAHLFISCSVFCKFTFMSQFGPLYAYVSEKKRAVSLQCTFLGSQMLSRWGAGISDVEVSTVNIKHVWPLGPTWANGNFILSMWTLAINMLLHFPCLTFLTSFSASPMKPFFCWKSLSPLSSLKPLTLSACSDAPCPFLTFPPSPDPLPLIALHA